MLLNKYYGGRVHQDWWGDCNIPRICAWNKYECLKSWSSTFKNHIFFLPDFFLHPAMTQDSRYYKNAYTFSSNISFDVVAGQYVLTLCLLAWSYTHCWRCNLGLSIVLFNSRPCSSSILVHLRIVAIQQHIYPEQLFRPILRHRNAFCEVRALQTENLVCKQSQTRTRHAHIRKNNQPER